MKKLLGLIFTMAIPAVLAGCATGLISAAKQGDVAALQKGLDAGADINESGLSGNCNGPPIAHAAYYCQPEAVRYLVKKGADMEAVGAMMGGQRPLHLAAAKDCIEVVLILLDAGADIKARSVRGSPLAVAAMGGKIKTVEYLIARGADIDDAITTLQKRDDSRGMALLEKYRLKIVVEAAREAQKQKSEEEQERIHLELKGADLARLLEMRPEKSFQIEALTKALIQAKNKELPGFLGRATVEDRVALLTTVELRLSDAQTLMARLTAMAEDAVRQGQSASPLRDQVGKTQVYTGVLMAIRNMLLQS